MRYLNSLPNVEKNHTIGEDLIKPSISALFKTVLEKDDNAVKAMPISNNIVSRRIDEMSDDIETQLVEKLKSRYFSLQMDASTLIDSEVVLQFCENDNAGNARLLLHTEVRSFSKENCLNRFMDLYVLRDKPEMKHLKTAGGKACVSYLTDIFEKLNLLNKQLQGSKELMWIDEAHFWLNGYVNKQNFRIWSEANPQVYVETPLHPEKLTVWCTLWAGGILLQKR
ncbi:SCAN domain-containing protein 3 [Trichonephila clavipes]|uniref:SCAN domain-containing protein 3 n=1 Tax=Trichonephila clavipes TaxID=2585209 RepID=A0A8X6WIZ9_TRICX|nr:SCAN domain-containing protein 3 [Trichonephila clavipes]